MFGGGGGFLVDFVDEINPQKFYPRNIYCHTHKAALRFEINTKILPPNDRNRQIHEHFHPKTFPPCTLTSHTPSYRLKYNVLQTDRLLIITYISGRVKAKNSTAQLALRHILSIHTEMCVCECVCSLYRVFTRDKCSIPIHSYRVGSKKS